MGTAHEAAQAQRKRTPQWKAKSQASGHYHWYYMETSVSHSSGPRSFMHPSCSSSHHWKDTPSPFYVCIIFKDPDLSGKANNVPIKLSLSGVHASRLFKPSVLTGRDRVWKDVCYAEHNFISQGAGSIGRFGVWAAFEALQPYMTGLTLTNEDRQSYKQRVEAWGDEFIRHFAEEHVTHYMVLLSLDLAYYKLFISSI